MRVDTYSKIIDTINDYQKLGTERLANGAYLVGKVPHIAPYAYLNVVFPPLIDSDIIELEQKMNMNIPTVFKEFLKQMNGVYLFSGTLAIYGKRANYNRDIESAWQPFDIIKSNTVERLNDAPRDSFFFGSYNWDGSLVYFNDVSQVIRCSCDSSVPLNVWNSFNDFIVMELERIDELYDSEGKEIDESVPTCPTSEK